MANGRIILTSGAREGERSGNDAEVISGMTAFDKQSATAHPLCFTKALDTLHAVAEDSGIEPVMRFSARSRLDIPVASRVFRFQA